MKITYVITGYGKFSTKPDAQKVDPHLNHNGERRIDLYRNFHFAPTTPSTEEGEEQFRIPGEDRNTYATVIGKFDASFTKRDPQSVLRDKFWLNLKRDREQSLI